LLPDACSCLFEEGGVLLPGFALAERLDASLLEQLCIPLDEGAGEVTGGRLRRVMASGKPIRQHLDWRSIFVVGLGSNNWAEYRRHNDRVSHNNAPCLRRVGEAADRRRPAYRNASRQISPRRSADPRAPLGTSPIPAERVLRAPARLKHRGRA